VTIRPATPADAIAIAELHAESWRSTYRGILRDDFLDGPVVEDRRRLWDSRLSGPSSDVQLVRLVEHDGKLKAFVCAFLDADAKWGALLDNLHVVPSSQDQGLGRTLMGEAAGWVLQHRPKSPLHLWVFKDNVSACQFYNHLGGVIAERHVHLAPDGSHVEAVRYYWEEARALLKMGAVARRTID
jgi:ribosomal protein S18 acetylase RimI-like enzyme